MDSDARRLRVELTNEIVLERGRSVVMRGRPGNRRLLVIADEPMSAHKIAAELRALASRLEEL